MKVSSLVRNFLYGTMEGSEQAESCLAGGELAVAVQVLVSNLV
jgi:hypothetical protein